MRDRTPVRATAFLIGFAIAVCSVTASESESGTAKKPKPYKVGDKIKPFSLTDVTGKECKLGELLGKKTLVISFWSVNCPVSKNFDVYYEALRKEYEDTDVLFVPIAANATEMASSDQIKKYLKDKKLGYVPLMDRGSKTAAQFGAATTPHVFIVDAKAVLRYAGAPTDSRSGGLEAKNDFIRDVLKALKAGKDPKVTETKAFGCGIKWPKSS